MTRRAVVAGLISTFGLLALSGAACAQDSWPNKPVRIIVNLAAGSGGDISGRVLSDQLSKTFGQPFILDFKPGANGIVGTEAAAKSPNDGYTLLYTYTAAHVVNPALYPKLSYDPVKDFTPVAQIGAGGNLLLVSPKLPVNNLSEFIAYVKSKPADELSYGSWGSGSGGGGGGSTLARSDLDLSPWGLPPPPARPPRDLPARRSDEVDELAPSLGR